LQPGGNVSSVARRHGIKPSLLFVAQNEAKPELAPADALAERLAPFDIVCVMRERTPLRRSLIERLPKLKLIASTGPINAAIDVKAAEEHGIGIVHTGYVCVKVTVKKG
jgi:lactate dehydrogenase-like 2-hydroxyacid dehydrogenase